jgi:signal transduction histidine kinase
VSLRLRLYVLVVGLVAAAVLAYVFPELRESRGSFAPLLHYGLWVLICVIAESLWLNTMSGAGTVTMASTAGLATAILWGVGPATWIVAVSTAIAELFVLKKPVVRALFNTSQAAITIFAAATVFTWLGGPEDGVESMVMAHSRDLVAVRMLAPALGLMVVYLLVNRGLVAAAVAWSQERPYLRVLREDWFFAERLLDDAAAFLMAPLMVVAFKSIGYAGTVLFYAPLRIMNESHRRFLELRNAQQQMIHTERMAAKGEMAAEIGHELRNQLAAISGRAQLLLKAAGKQEFDNVPRHTQVILEQAQRMTALSNGLLGFSYKEIKVEKVDLNSLIQRSIEFVRSQNRFDGVEWETQYSDPSPELRADPGQLEQVLLNLFMNAADAMKENGIPRKLIRVSTSRDDREQRVAFVVSDTGTGIPGSNLRKIFEPHFTTKKTGHGFGLSTSYRIITNHGGKIEVESPIGQGATFTITLPTHRQDGWSPT